MAGGSTGIPAGSLRRDGGTPLYIQIRDRITAAVKSGALAVGERLPSEPELVDMFAVGRPTVRQAIALLRQEGWVVTRRGLGTYVAGSTGEVSLLGFDGLTRSLAVRGLAVRDEIVATEIVTAPAFEVLDVGDPARWWSATRLRSVVRELSVAPLCVETDFFPLAVCPQAPELFAQTGSATAVLQETYGLAVASCEVATRAVAIPTHWQDTLQLPAGGPVLAMERINRSSDGMALHAVSFLFRTDLVPLVEHLRNPDTRR